MPKPGRLQATLLVLSLASGCYEIPPALAPGGAPAGWLPAAVYAPEPFHPLNRWFHRAFAGRGAAGDLIPAASDEPLPLATTLDAVDRAELIALLGAIGPNDVAGAAASWLFRSDALACACRFSQGLEEGNASPPCRELVVSLLAAARSPAPLTPALLEASLAAVPTPPPLRRGRWTEVEAPGSPEILPSAIDPRWTRLLAAAGTAGELEASPRRTVLLRLRVGLDERGAALLLPLASECWDLEWGSGGGPAPRRWCFDRARSTSGEDPWRETWAGEQESTRLIDILREPPRPLTGASKALQNEKAESLVGSVVDSCRGNR